MTREAAQTWIVLAFTVTICGVVIWTVATWGVHGEASPEVVALRARMYDVILFMLGIIGASVNAHTQGRNDVGQ